MTRTHRVAAAGVLSLLMLAPVAPLPAPFAPPAAVAAQVDINTASLEELEAIPGIGPAKAQAIVAYRAVSPFASTDELQNVKGIGAKLYERIKDQVTVGTAVRD
jgi:competence protein ComEA